MDQKFSNAKGRIKLVSIRRYDLPSGVGMQLLGEARCVNAHVWICAEFQSNLDLYRSAQTTSSHQQRL